MKKTKTYSVTIYCGLKNRDTGKTHTLQEAYNICQEWVDEVGQCVSFTETNYIYTNGSEKGIIVGFINYPRFPKSKKALKKQALELARILMETLEQYKVSVVLPDKTIMLENEPN